MQEESMFLVLNGKVIPADEAFRWPYYNGRAVRVSQKIWFGYGGIPLLNENMELLRLQAGILKIPFPRELDNAREVYRLTKRMLNKNRFYKSGYLMAQLVQSGKITDWFITASPSADNLFPAAGEHLLAGFSSIRKYSKNIHNSYHFFNETLWDCARAEITGSEYGQAIVLNERDEICDAIGSNIYMLHEMELITPVISSGCLIDTTRNMVLEAARKIGLGIKELPAVRKDFIYDVEEAFLVSEQEGFQWILGVGPKRYFRYYSQKIYAQLNEMLQGKAYLQTSR